MEPRAPGSRRHAGNRPDHVSRARPLRYRAPSAPLPGTLSNRGKSSRQSQCLLVCQELHRLKVQSRLLVTSRAAPLPRTPNVMSDVRPGRTGHASGQVRCRVRLSPTRHAPWSTVRADGDVPALVAVGWACAVVLDDIGSPIAVNREGIKDPAGRWHAAVGPLADGAGKAPASASACGCGCAADEMTRSLECSKGQFAAARSG